MKQLEDMVKTELEEMATRKMMVVEMSPVLAYMLIAQCQLAFRHPGNEGASRFIVEDFVESLRGRICEPGSAVDVSIKMGYDHNQDRRAPPKSDASSS